MSSKCIKIRNCFCFFIFSVGLLYLSTIYYPEIRYTYCRSPQYLRFSSPELQRYHKYCCLTDFLTRPLKTPSLESFIRASSTEEDQELRLRGLAVYSNLTNACQPPVDVSKSNIHVNSLIALITIANETVCSLPEVAVNAQNAGYSVVIYFAQNCIATYTDTQDKLVIPFVWAGCYLNDSLLRKADQSDVQISVSQAANALSKMQKYLKRLYYWFLLGPLITLEWLRRTKKFCCMSGGQQVNEERGTEDEEAVGETSLHSVVGETRENNNQETEDEQTAGEKQPLIVVTGDPHSNLTNTKHRRPTTIRRVTTPFAKTFGKFAVGCGYVILIIAALPVGISSGGWSFFRFDENEDVDAKPFWDDVFNDPTYNEEISDAILPNRVLPKQFLKQFLVLWWSPLQIFCFFSVQSVCL